MLVSESDSDNIQRSIRRGTTPCRGVNLGGWLVVEHWMSMGSSIWEGVPGEVANKGEYATMEFLGHEKGDSRFEEHRSTWITESDIAEIARSGMNTVRVPVGWWIVGYDNHDNSGKQEWKIFAPGSLKYVDTLINDWAPKNNIAVMVDIHAVKGSQNGRDHSAAPVAGQKFWSKYPENVANAVEVARFLADRYKNSEAFLGLGLLNEPEEPTDIQVLASYYGRAYELIRRTGNDCVLVHSPLLTQQGPNDWNWKHFAPPPNFHTVWHEWHRYLLWGYEGKTEDEIMFGAVDQSERDFKAWTGNWLFIGEWSLGHPDSAPFNNRDKLRAYAKRMLNALQAPHAGWTFWSWKVKNGAEFGGGWSMQDLIQGGIINLK